MLTIPPLSEESDDEIYEPFRSNKQKIMSELYLPFLTFIISLGIIISIRCLIDVSSFTFVSDQLSNLFSINSSIRLTEEMNEDSINNSNIFNNKAHFISQVNHLIYTGSYLSGIDTGQHEESLIYMQINTNRNKQPNGMTIKIRTLENHSVDSWKNIQMNADFDQIRLNNDTSSFNIDTESTSDIDIGELFDIKTFQSNCVTTLHLNFSSISSISSSKENGVFNNVMGKAVSKDCDLAIDIQLALDNSQSDFKVITLYSCLLSFLCICSLINTIWLNIKLNDSESFSNAISLFTVAENIIWNSFGCLSHLYLTINSVKYFYQFLIPTLLYMTNFAITDLKLLYTLWRLKYSRILLNTVLVNKKLLQLYCIFYIMMFVSLFYIKKFYFNKAFILLGISLTWTPEIIFNALYMNKISLPGIYILFLSISRLFFPCYCRGYNNNFLLISTDYLYVIICIASMMFFCWLMWSQSKYGQRWFLPQFLRESRWDFYKTLHELKEIKPEVENIECVICLYPLINSDSAKYFTNDFIDEAKNNYNPINLKEVSMNSTLKHNCFNFHERSSNHQSKPFMLTQCNHAFHSNCLESWFMRKRECPNCRTELNVY